jgi:hypothetical protein
MNFVSRIARTHAYQIAKNAAEQAARHQDLTARAAFRVNPPSAITGAAYPGCQTPIWDKG